MFSLGMITIDTPNPAALAHWWAQRLNGHVHETVGDEFCMVSAPGLPSRLCFQLVEAASPGKNRLHLDLVRNSDHGRLRALAELVAAGATHLIRRESDGFGWDVFEDPDGNQFCVSDPY